MCPLLNDLPLDTQVACYGLALTLVGAVAYWLIAGTWA